MPHIIRSLDLERFFDSTSRRAQELLPLVIYRLIRATTRPAEVIAIRFPSGDDVSLPGLDGELTYGGRHPYLPTGDSAWEMGLSKTIKAKADEDYAKRTADSETDHQKCTFVFVTPRRWGGGRNWAIARKRERKWRDVRVIDGVDLEAWMGLVPALSIWMASELGLTLDGLTTLEQQWTRIAAAWRPIDLPPELLLHGRANAQNALRKWLADTTSPLSLVGETVEEALAFGVAAILSFSKNGDLKGIGDRIVAVSNPVGARYLNSIPNPPILLLTDPSQYPNVCSHELQGARVLIPEKRGARENSRRQAIKLQRLTREAVETVFRSSGATEGLARRYAHETKGSFEAVQWMILQPDPGTIPWATGALGNRLAPLVLVGQWDSENPSDQALVAWLVGRSYESIREDLVSHTESVSPFVRNGSVCGWKAFDFFWRRLGPLMDTHSLQRFHRLAVALLRDCGQDGALSTQFPNTTLSPQLLTNASKALRMGVAQTIALLGVSGEALPDQSGQRRARDLVSEILDPSIARPTWCEAPQILPELAEAAPREFLKAIRAIARTSASAERFFSPPNPWDTPPVLYARWGLEHLAWCTEHFIEVVVALGALARAEPEGTKSSGKDRLPRHLLLPWCTLTGASVELQFQAVKALLKEEAEIGWDCAVSLMPKDHDIASEVDRPRWRSWDISNRNRTRGEMFRYHQQLVPFLIEHAARNGVRLAQLLPGAAVLMNVQPPLAMQIIDHINRLDVDALDEPSRRAIGRAAHDIVAWHECYPTSDEALGDSEIDQFRHIRDRFTLPSARERYRWLFDEWPRIPSADALSFTDQEQELTERRKRAVAEVLNQEGIVGIVRWSEEIANPRALGGVMALCELDQDHERQYLRDLLATIQDGDERKPSAQLLLGFAFERSRNKGEEWREWVSRSLADVLSPPHLVLLALALPHRLSTWKWIEKLGPDIQTRYWKLVSMVVVAFADAEYAVTKLLATGRLFDAMTLVSMLVHNHIDENADSGTRDHVCNLMRCVLSAPDTLPCCMIPEGPCSPMVAYHFDRFHDFLAQQGVSAETLADWEWKWMPALDRHERKLKSLGTCIGRSPRRFVELLRFRYLRTAADVPPSHETDDLQRRLSHAAFDAMESWDVVPGFRHEGPPQPDPNDEPIPRPAAPACVGTVDGAALLAWCQEARALCNDSGLKELCDIHIGRQFAFAPADHDKVWPCASVAAVIEALWNDEIESGFVTGVCNRRGVYNAGRDGVAESQIARYFRTWQEHYKNGAPHTSMTLGKVASNYEREARDAIEEGEQEDYDG